MGKVDLKFELKSKCIQLRPTQQVAVKKGPIKL
jgi:hypothetical protein